MEQATNPILRKPSGAINIRNRFSLLEEKILNTIMYDLQDSGGSRVDGSLELTTFSQYIGRGKSKDLKPIKDAFETLISTVVTWNHTGVDRSTLWEACALLTSAKIKTDGRVYYKINPDLVDKLTKPRVYARMFLMVQRHLSRRYSLILYEYLADHISREREQPKSLVVEKVYLDKLKELFGVDDSDAYRGPDNNKHFNAKILKPAVKEVHDKSDLEVTFEADGKEGRRVVSIAFTITRKDSFQMGFGFEKGEDTPALPNQAQLEKLVAELIDIGVGETQARDLCLRFDAERIEGNIAHYRETAQTKTIPKPGAWLYKAVIDDYRPKLSPSEQRAKDEAAQKKEARKRRERREAELEALKKEFDSFQHTQARTQFATRTKTFQTRRRNAFEKASKGDIVKSRLLKDGGWDNKIFQSLFYSDLVKDPAYFSQPYERDFESWLAWRKEAPAQSEQVTAAG